MKEITLSNKTHKEFTTTKLFLSAIDDKNYTESQVIDYLIDFAKKQGGL